MSTFWGGHPYTDSNIWLNAWISILWRWMSFHTNKRPTNVEWQPIWNHLIQEQGGHFLFLFFFWVRPINQYAARTFPPPSQCLQLIQMISAGNPKGQSIHLHISILCPIRPWLAHASIALVKTLLIAAPASHPSSTTSARGPSRQCAAQECNNTLNDCSGSSHPSQPIKKTAAAPRESTCSLRWHGWSWCLWETVRGGWLWTESRHLFYWLCVFCVLLLFLCCYGVAKYFLNTADGRLQAAGCPTNLSHESCIRYLFMLVSVSNVQMSVCARVCVCVNV